MSTTSDKREKEANGTPGRKPKFLDVIARRDLSKSSKLLYVVLRIRQGNNGKCWPGIRTLAKDLHASPSTVSGALGELRDRLGLQIDGRGTGRSNEYRLPDQLPTVPEIGTVQESVPEIGTVKVQVQAQPCRKPAQSVPKTGTGPYRKSAPEDVREDVREDVKKKKGARAPSVTFDAETATFAVPDELKQRWFKKYPSLDLEVEFSKAGEHYASPTARKCRDWQKALAGWLNRAIDYQRQGRASPKRGTFKQAEVSQEQEEAFNSTVRQY